MTSPNPIPVLTAEVGPRMYGAPAGTYRLGPSLKVSLDVGVYSPSLIVDDNPTSIVDARALVSCIVSGAQWAIETLYASDDLSEKFELFAFFEKWRSEMVGKDQLRKMLKFTTTRVHAQSRRLASTWRSELETKDLMVRALCACQLAKSLAEHDEIRPLEDLDQVREIAEGAVAGRLSAYNEVTRQARISLARVYGSSRLPQTGSGANLEATLRDVVLARQNHANNTGRLYEPETRPGMPPWA